MVSKIWIINILLALLVAFLGLMTYGVWSKEDVVSKIDNTSKTDIKAPKISANFFDERSVLPETGYSVVVTKNLFAFERTEGATVKETPVEKKQTLTVAQQKELDQLLEKMTLYGLVITDDSAKALVTDVGYTTIKKGGRSIRSLKFKKVKWIKPGDSLGTFKVAEIKNDRVLLISGKEKYELLLYDKKKSKSRRPLKPKTGPTVVGVSVKSPVSNVNEKKAIVPTTDKKKGIPPKILPKSAPPPAQNPFTKTIEKTKVR